MSFFNRQAAEQFDAPTTAVEDISGDYTIDPTHSHTEFAVRHLMISTVKGRFGGLAGTVVTDETDPARVEVDITIDVNSLDTREPQRDAHLKSPDFFDAAAFPAITFTSRRVQPAAGGAFALTGDLTLRGVTREVVLDVTIEGEGRDPWGNHRTGFSATGRISRKDFGLTWNQLLETGGVAVGDEVKITIDTELIQQVAAA